MSMWCKYSIPMNLSRWQRNILIGKGNQVKGTFSGSQKHLEHFGRTASTKNIFQGTQLFSSKWREMTTNYWILCFSSWYLVISSIGLGHTEKTVIFINQLGILSRVEVTVSNTRFIFTILDQLYNIFIQ